MFVFSLLYVSKIGFGRFLAKRGWSSGLPELLLLRGMILSCSIPNVPEETHGVLWARSSGIFYSARILNLPLARKPTTIVLIYNGKPIS
jgi:hypothetical protein